MSNKIVELIPEDDDVEIIESPSTNDTEDSQDPIALARELWLAMFTSAVDNLTYWEDDKATSLSKIGWAAEMADKMLDEFETRWPGFE